MEKSPNKSTSTTTGANATAASTEKENHALKAPPSFKLNDAAQAHSYISPSDALLSPTTKKLEEMKGKRFATAGKNGGSGSGSLLRKMVKSQSEKSLSGS